MSDDRKVNRQGGPGEVMYLGDGFLIGNDVWGFIDDNGNFVIQKPKGTNIATFGANVGLAGKAPVIRAIVVPDGATGNVDTVLTYGFRVVDVWVVKTTGAGGASDTITVLSTGDAITDAIDINIADKVMARAGTIDDAKHEIAAGGTLRVTRTKSSGANVACIVYVLGYPI